MLIHHEQLYSLVLSAVTITAVEWDVWVFACVEGDNIGTGSLGSSSQLPGSHCSADLPFLNEACLSGWSPGFSVNLQVTFAPFSNTQVLSWSGIPNRIKNTIICNNKQYQNPSKTVTCVQPCNGSVGLMALHGPQVKHPLCQDCCGREGAGAWPGSIISQLFPSPTACSTACSPPLRVFKWLPCHAIVLQSFATSLANWTSQHVYVFEPKAQVTANPRSTGCQRQIQWHSSGLAAATWHEPWVWISDLGMAHLAQSQPGNRHIHSPFWSSFLHKVSDC